MADVFPEEDSIESVYYRKKKLFGLSKVGTVYQKK